MFGESLGYRPTLAGAFLKAWIEVTASSSCASRMKWRIVSKLVQTATAMESLTKTRTMNVSARHAVALVLYAMTTMKK